MLLMKSMPIENARKLLRISHTAMRRILKYWIEKAVKKVIKYAPDGYVILCLSITPNKSWLLANKDQLMTNAKGEYAIIRDYAVRGLYSKEFPDKIGYSWYPSTSSVKYQKDMAAVLQKALTEFEKTDAAKAVAAIY